jgi:hypothetical protein
VYSTKPALKASFAADFVFAHKSNFVELRQFCRDWPNSPAYDLQGQAGRAFSEQSIFDLRLQQDGI